MNNSSPLVALKTRLELKAEDDVVQVYVVEVPIRMANETLKQLKSITEPMEMDLQHLRRFAKPGELPRQIRLTLSKSTPAVLYLLVGPITSINLLDLEEIISSALSGPDTYQFGIRTTEVPLLAPTSPEQARSWSSSYWPTVYKKSNPFGPHSSIISRAESEVIRDLDIWMTMAARAAMVSKSTGYGEAIAAVIIKRESQGSHAVALAGDSRWKGHDRDGVGNPMAHAVLRAIGMVAQKLRAAEGRQDFNHSHEQEQDLFLDCPLMSEEKAIYETDYRLSSGYLCNGLEIYITHEPCVACSMALLHSRFDRVIFGQRMPRTGGLCSETCEAGRLYGGLGHGLFWRKELNWSFLAWQTEVNDVDLHIDSALHA